MLLVGLYVFPAEKIEYTVNLTYKGQIGTSNIYPLFTKLMWTYHTCLKVCPLYARLL